MTTLNTTSPTAGTSNLFGVSSSGAGSATGTTAATPAAQQQQFLQLLIAQMQNQDPMNPMDNSQITSQMAQISTVSGLDTLNNSMSGLASTFASSQALQSANLIGRTVLAPSSTLALASGQAAGGINLSDKADSVKVTVKDAAGNVVQTVDLGAQSAGVLPFSWDGTDASGNKLPDGNYSFSVAASMMGTAVTAATLGAGLVQSVTLSNGSVNVTAGGLGTIGVDQIEQII